MRVKEDATVKEEFKDHLRIILSDLLGEEVEEGLAWHVFRNMLEGTAQFIAEKESISIHGVGRFALKKSDPKGKRLAEGWTFVPRFKFYPSTVLHNKLATYLDQNVVSKVSFTPLGIFKKEEKTNLLENSPAGEF